MQRFYPEKRVRRLLIAVAILSPIAIICLIQSAGSQAFSIGLLIALVDLIVAGFLLLVCRIEIDDDTLRFRYPFKPFRNQFSYVLAEIAEVQMTIYGETPTISLVFKEEHRRETMYSEGRAAMRSHYFSRRQLREIRDALKARQIYAAVA